MPYKDVAEIALAQGIVERQIRASGYSRHDPDSLPLQKLDEERRAVELHDSSLMPEASAKKKPPSASTEGGSSQQS
jgi:hypothetical protein